MTTEKLRAWWFHRQRLDGRLRGGSAAEVLEAADAAVAALEIHELPAARG